MNNTKAFEAAKAVNRILEFSGEECTCTPSVPAHRVQCTLPPQQDFLWLEGLVLRLLLLHTASDQNWRWEQPGKVFTVLKHCTGRQTR